MIVPLEFRHALHVCLRMRESDRRVISQTRFVFDPEDFALERYRLDGLKLAALARDGKPVGIGGLAPKVPGVWIAWVLGTDRWGECGGEVVWFARRAVRRLLAEGGGHRVEAHAAAEDAKARRYMELVGLKYEGTLRGARSQGSDLAVYAIVKGAAG